MTSKTPARWDWNGIIGSGQSLSVGAIVGAGSILSTEQPFGNLKLSLARAKVPPWDPDQPGLEMVPLVEPLRPLATQYPSAYPDNLYGETLHTAMANQISALARAELGVDHVIVPTVVGECGQGMSQLIKHDGPTTGVTGRAYAAFRFEVAALARLAAKANKTYGVRVLVMTHGETDWNSPTYRDELITLLEDTTRDAAVLTGQTEPLVMFLSQTFALPTGRGERPLATQTQWRLGVDYPGRFVCTGPKYQYAGPGDGIHLLTSGYQQLGEKSGQIYFERFLRGRDWQPLHPLSATRDGDDAILVHFHVPVPPLTWDETLPEPLAWPNGRGFEVRQGDTPIPIRSVALGATTARITCDQPLPERGLVLGYAMTSAGVPMPTVPGRGTSGAYRWGKLRDSDPFVGWVTRAPQPNYCVSFEIAVD